MKFLKNKLALASVVFGLSCFGAATMYIMAPTEYECGMGVTQNGQPEVITYGQKVLNYSNSYKFEFKKDYWLESGSMSSYGNAGISGTKKDFRNSKKLDQIYGRAIVVETNNPIFVVEAFGADIVLASCTISKTKLQNILK